MSREKSLAKNTLIITVGQVCTKLITFLLLPLYTGILSTTDYGIVDLVNTLSSLIVPLVTLQIEQAAYRELIEHRNDSSKHSVIITNSTIIIVVQCISILLLYMLFSIFIKNDYKVYLLINVLVTTFLCFFQQIARGLGENTKYAIGSFISAIFVILFNLFFLLVMKLEVIGMLLGTILGGIIGIIYFVISLKLIKNINFKNFDKIKIKEMLKYSLPLIPSTISWWVFNASNRVIVTRFLGVDQNGILAAALKFSSIYAIIYNIVYIGWLESISLSINDKDIKDYYNKVFNIILRLFSAMAIGMIACMPFVFPIMINSKFASGYNIIPISIISSFFNVIEGLMGAVYIAKKNTKIMGKTAIYLSIVNIFLHIVLIKYIGLYAAVLSTLVSFLALAIFRIWHVSKKYFKIKISKELVLKFLITLIFILVCYYIDNLYLNVVSFIFAVIFAVDINKDSATTIISYLKLKLKKCS